MVIQQHAPESPRKRLTVHRGKVGWELREEVGSQVVRTSTHTDWHRVERAIQVFERDVDFEDEAPRPVKA